MAWLRKRHATRLRPSVRAILRLDPVVSGLLIGHVRRNKRWASGTLGRFETLEILTRWVEPFLLEQCVEC